MDIESKVSALERSTLFNGLPRQTLEAGAKAASEKKLGKGSTLFLQGDKATTHHILASGRLRLDQTTADGKNIVLRFMGPGDLVGSVAVLRGVAYPATPTAVEETRTLFWTHLQMMELLKAHPALALKTMNMMGGRIEELQERLQLVATQQVERRIAATILRIATQSGQKSQTGVEIPFVLSRQDLAEMTGTTLHTVSRTLSAWIEDGIIAGRRSSHIVIRMPHRLVEISEQA